MASNNQLRVGNRVQFVDKSRSQTLTRSTDSLTTPANYTDMTAMDTYLLTINGGASYTQRRLDKMTVNDKIYAIRIHAENSDSGML